MTLTRGRGLIVLEHCFATPKHKPGSRDGEVIGHGRLMARSGVRRQLHGGLHLHARDLASRVDGEIDLQLILAPLPDIGVERCRSQRQHSLGNAISDPLLRRQTHIVERPVRDALRWYVERSGKIVPVTGERNPEFEPARLQTAAPASGGNVAFLSRVWREGERVETALLLEEATDRGRGECTIPDGADIGICEVHLISLKSGDCLIDLVR
ncbi:MAG: hypothetical protein WBA63_10985 [Thermomicrobiales bacterium]